MIGGNRIAGSMNGTLEPSGLLFKRSLVQPKTKIHVYLPSTEVEWHKQREKLCNSKESKQEYERRTEGME